VVNDKVTIDRPTIRRMRAILHRAKTDGLDSQNRNEHPNFSMWVSGMIAYIEMVNPTQGAKLRRAFDAL
jgi:RNA-directed DNA polymerase